MSFITKHLKLDHFEPDRIVTSNLVRPLTLAILRGLICLYTLIVIVSVWVTAESASEYLKFFTNLTYFGLVVYLVCSTIWSVNYLRQPTSSRAAWLKSGSPWWGYLHWLLYSTVVTYHFIVPIVYWTMLSTGATLTSFGHWQNYSVHAIDGVFALFELIFNRHFLQPVHSVVLAFVMMLYMCLTFVVKQTKGTWVYPFLDWDQGVICVAGMGLEAEREAGFGASGGRRVQLEENVDGGYYGNQSESKLEEGGDGAHDLKGMQTY
ncbi:hypothetical protein BGZ96_005927 [Linnemannia gamsii]|uniref:Uncharacterized protein n=1 Tax=Linnemannia gamsii TaxID=64522 RepID=A0ABQ7K4M6_9FUNG|nr:hypothetical protein BGZ96_005927 [Linnemannia gamsii]